MTKKFISAILIGLTLCSSSVSSLAADTKDTVIVLNIGKSSMQVNGEEKNIDSDIDVTPVLLNDTTMVPIRAIVEAMGGNVQWEEAENKVTVQYQNNKVQVWLDKDTALVNGNEVKISAAPTTIHERTMLPLRFVSEGLGLFVNWEDSNEGISISQTNDYVAVAGGIKVDKATYNIYLSTAKSEILENFSQNNIDLGPDSNIWSLSIEGGNLGDMAKRKALESSIQHGYFLKQAQINNISLSADEISNINSSISQMVQQEGGEQSAEKKIQSYHHVSLSEYTQFVKDFRLANKYLYEYGKNQILPAVSPDDVNMLYDKNKSSLEKVTVSHILISTADKDGAALTQDKQDAAKKKAEDILARVKNGEDFAALAKQYSDDAGSKDSGGEYTFARGKMVKEFEDWAFQAKDGDMGIIKTAYGYHVMKFLGKTSEDQIKASIKNSLADDQLRSYISNVVADFKPVTVINHSVYDAIEVN